MAMPLAKKYLRLCSTDVKVPANGYLGGVASHLLVTLLLAFGANAREIDSHVR